MLKNNFLYLVFVLVGCSNSVMGIKKFNEASNNGILLILQNNATRICNICLETKEASAFEIFTCEHNICIDCFTLLIDAMIQEKDTTFLQCPDCARQHQDKNWIY